MIDQRPHESAAQLIGCALPGARLQSQAHHIASCLWTRMRKIVRQRGRLCNQNIMNAPYSWALTGAVFGVEAVDADLEANPMISAMHLAVFLIAAILAATPTYYVLRRTDEGRARGAIAYLMGFFFGLAGFLMLPTRDTMLSESALLAAFSGPFVGMARARYMRQRRERNKSRRRGRRGDELRA